MGIKRIFFENDFSARDARQIQQVFNQPRLQLDVFTDVIEIRSRSRRQVVIVFGVAGDQQNRIQRRAQFMAQRGEKIVLRTRSSQRRVVRLLQFLQNVLAFDGKSDL